MILTKLDLTQIGHLLIILGVAAAYLKSRKVEDLIKIQQDTIDALQKGFDICKARLAELEKKVGQ